MVVPTSTLAERVEWLNTFIKQYPYLPAPSVDMWSHYGGIDLNWHTIGLTDDEQIKTARTVLDSIGGTWETVRYNGDAYIKQKHTQGTIEIGYTIFLKIGMLHLLDMDEEVEV